MLAIPACIADDGSTASDPGTPAESEASSEISNACLQIGLTSVSSGRYLHGYGSVSCANNSANITIRRQRFFSDDELVTSFVPGLAGDVHITYDCIGTGTHTFYTRIWATALGGGYAYKDSNFVTVTCP
jgi:hypothetical protein